MQSLAIGAELVECGRIDAIGAERGECIFCYVAVATAQIGLLADVDLLGTEILGFNTEDLCFQTKQQVFGHQYRFQAAQMAAYFQDAVV